MGIRGRETKPKAKRVRVKSVKPIPKKIREQVYAKYNGHCAYCGCEISYKELQVDHLIPHSRQDLLALHNIEDANQISNLMPSCRQCNFRKSDYELETFRKDIATTLNRLRKYVWNYNFAIKYKLIAEQPKEILFYFEKKGS